EIVRNLRNFAREDSEADFSDYDIEEGLRSTLIVARNEVKYVAAVEFSPGGVPHIPAVGGEINQVLLNLVLNAAQAIGEQKRDGLGRILIATSVEDDRVVLNVDDDGPGIPEALRLRVFDPFFTTKDPGKGTGLGLSISYDIIVTKHGGRLIVGDSPLGGASFRIELPLRRTIDSTK
nr:ATP-binding protein [Treponema sp.]